MASLIKWERPSMLRLQRDIEELMEDFVTPRAMRRELDRLFDELPAAPRSLWTEMDQLFDQFESPPTLRRRVADLFQNVVGTLKVPFKAREKQEAEMFIPSIELDERDNEYLLKADLPGMKEADIDVQLSGDNMLTVSGQRRDEETKRAKGYEYTERSYGSFSRSIQLPPGIEVDKIEAELKNGVLEVHVPKTEQSKPRHIPVAREEQRARA